MKRPTMAAVLSDIDFSIWLAVAFTPCGESVSQLFAGVFAASTFYAWVQTVKYVQAEPASKGVTYPR
eukprot:scaffold581834_cov24-Prasinocladus_malaysianus.AAC.1